jgi:hypothetical protein
MKHPVNFVAAHDARATKKMGEGGFTSNLSTSVFEFIASFFAFGRLEQH